MPTVNIEDKLYEDIREYCRLNKLTISVFVNDLLKRNFMVEKYDDAPPFFKKRKQEEDAIHEDFSVDYTIDPNEGKKKEYVKPEVISAEVKKDEKALTEREKARLKTQYL